jgi:hypothetical protein
MYVSSCLKYSIFCKVTPIEINIIGETQKIPNSKEKKTIIEDLTLFIKRAKTPSLLVMIEPGDRSVPYILCGSKISSPYKTVLN